MELRRAILLFAIVLGLAAIATSLSRQPRTGEDGRSDRGTTSRPTANPGPGEAPPARPDPPIVFSAGEGKAPTESLPTGRAAALRVETEEPGQVSVDGLGLLAYADPLAPARLDVLTTVPDRYEVTFKPTAGGQRRTVGYLQVTP